MNGPPPWSLGFTSKWPCMPELSFDAKLGLRALSDISIGKSIYVEIMQLVEKNLEIAVRAASYGDHICRRIRRCVPSDCGGAVEGRDQRHEVRHEIRMCR